MGFEAPLALLALAAAALPIVAHLLRRQDLPVRKLATVKLLERAQASSRRRVRIVDLLLMIVRILLIALFAFALAGPFAKVSLAYGDGTVASIVLVIDDSMSMAGRGDPSLLARARERAEAIVESLPEGSEVAIVLAGAPARVHLARTAELAAAERALEDAGGASARGTDLTTALALAERELAGARHAARHVVLLSDFAAHGELTDASIPAGLEVRVENLGEDAPTRNAAVVDARATPDPTTPGRASVAIEIRAQEMNGDTIDVVLRRGGEELARQGVLIAENGARTILHARVDPADPGAEGSIEVEDAIATDNARGVLLRAPTGVRVLVVDGDPAPIPGAERSRFFVRAIDLAPEEGGALTRRRIDPETLAAMDPSEADVLVLANVPVPSERVVEKLREHVEHGGGLWIAPGDQFDARAYVARFGDLLPASPRAAPMAEVGGPYATPDNAILPAGTSGLEQTQTRRRLTFESIDPEANVVLTFGDGTPALLVARRGDGRVAMLATSLSDDWSDLPLRPGYLPLVATLLRHLAPSGSGPSTAIAPATPVALTPPAGTTRVRVLRPDGQPIDHNGDAPFRVTETEAAGVYRVQVASRSSALHEEARFAFVVGPPPEESDLTAGEVPESARGSDDDQTSAAFVHRPLAPWLFLFVGLFAIMEAALRMRAGQLARRAA